MKKVILISGKLQCGKNQFTEYLKDHLVERGLKVSTDLFAKSLKDGCKEDFKILANVLSNISAEIKAKVNLLVDQRELMIYGDQFIKSIESSIDKLNITDDNWYEEKTSITRTILQLVGTQIFRKRVNDNWWVNQVKDRCIQSNDDVIIITDCRFPNEINGMFDNSFETIVIRIERNINTNESISNHESEIALDNWKEFDFIVENNRTLKDLKDSAKTISNYLTEKSEEEYDGLFTRLSKENLQFLSKMY